MAWCLFKQLASQVQCGQYSNTVASFDFALVPNFAHRLVNPLGYQKQVLFSTLRAAQQVILSHDLNLEPVHAWLRSGI